MKAFIRSLIPPIITDHIKLKPRFGWFGNYPSWQEAEKHCTGYDAGNILEKVKAALLKVKSGEAVYERDSVLFDQIEYAWPLLACLAKCASENGNQLHVLDFGGSLGSTYYQNKSFLSFLKSLEWSIVEQSHFVNCGKEYFQDDTLKFYETIEDCLKERKAHVLLLSSVLQYLENVGDWIVYFKQQEFDYIVVDRTPFLSSEPDRITVQKVPPFIYEASYVCRYFNEAEFLGLWTDRYQVVCEFDALDVSTIKKAYFKGYLLRKKEMNA